LHVDSPFVTHLRAELEARLAALVDETAAIRKALAALDRPSSRRPRRTRVDLGSQLLQELAATPGARASLLAMSLNRDPAEVQLVLSRLEASGQVSRSGLGWSLLQGAADSEST
jgi:hypothetical protein